MQQQQCQFYLQLRTLSVIIPPRTLSVINPPCLFSDLEPDLESYHVVPKKYSRLTENQTMEFCYVYIFLDPKYLFIDLDFDTPTTQIR